MPREQIFIPVARGVDTSADERVRSPGELTAVTNGVFRVGDRAAIAKRNGFTRISNVVASHTGTVVRYGTPKGIFSTGEELCIRGYRNLYAYNTIESAWYDRGTLSPFTGTLETVFHDQLSHSSVDHWQNGTYRGYITMSVRQYEESTLATEFAIHWRATTTDDHVVLGDVVLAKANNTAPSRPDSPRVGGCAGKLLPCYVDGAFGAAATLRIHEYVLATPTTAPVNVVTQADVYRPITDNQRPYDIIELDDGNYAYAYVENTAQNIKLFIRSPNHLLLATNLIDTGAAGEAGNPPYEMLALHQDPATEQIYMIAVCEPSEDGTRQVEMWAFNDTTLARNWGPVVLYTIPVTEFVYSVGVAFGTDIVTGASRAVGVWTVWTRSNVDSKGNATGSEDWRIDNRSTDVLGLNLDDRHSIYNCAQRTKPFWKGGRCYVAGFTTGGKVAADASVILDLNITGSTGERMHQLAGVYDVGVAPIAGDPAVANKSVELGSANNVFTTATVDTPARYASISAAFVLDTELTPLSDLARYAGDMVELNFDEAPLSITATHGSSLVGGGACAWYSGVATEELGFAMPPMVIDTNGQTDPSGALAVGTYQYQAMWEGYDEHGNWHRSAPSPPVSGVVVAGQNSIDVTTLALGATNGLVNKRNFGMVVYRAEADGVFERISDAIRVIPNADSYYCDAYRDLGTGDLGPPIYTQGGAEVAAAMPEGAAIATVGPRRVWLSGFFRRDRIQYTKNANPGTANEDAIAPEFNEAFTYILPGGKRCTGLAIMDDKTVVFTADEVYALAGFGPDDGGSNNDFSGLQPISSDAGCIEPRSVVSVPGGVFFQSAAGIYVLTRSMEMNFIGEAVQDTLALYPTITSAVVVPGKTHIRFTCLNPLLQSVVLIYDYGIKAWTTWTPKTAAAAALHIIGATMHNGDYYMLTADGTVWQEDQLTYRDDGTAFVELRIETSWFQSKPNGWNRVRSIVAMCQRQDHHNLTMTISHDFEGAGGVGAQSYTWQEATIAQMPSPNVREQLMARVQQQKATATKVAIYDTISPSTTTGEGYTCAGFTFEVMPKRGVVKVGKQQRN